MKFIPNVYLRLIKRVSRPHLGTVEYMVTPCGIDDPECTIIPVMAVSGIKKDGPQKDYYLAFEGKVYKAEREEYLNLHVKLGAKPTGIDDDLPAA